MSATARKGAISEPKGIWVEKALAVARERQSATLPAAAQKLAHEAASVWGKLLFPTPSLEEWKYTNPEEIAAASLALPPAIPAQLSEDEIGRFCVPQLECSRLVFVDGHFSEKLSRMPSQAGLTVSRLQSGGEQPFGALKAHETEPFAALASALLSDGVCVSVQKNIAVTTPLHIIHLATKGAESCVITPRLFIEAGECSQVTVVESSVSLGAARYLSLPITEVRAAQGATVDLYKFQEESPGAFHVSNTDVEQSRNSTVRTHIFSFGGQLVRNNVNVRLAGSNCNAVLNGLSVLSSSQHVDNATMIHHIEPSSESREHFKGIYADKSRGVFSGTITVEQIAQKTNAFQSNQALLLSPNASLETRPQLKIWADDVKCTHGATVGQLNAEAMYYLRSRGIDRETARNFLVHAFASEVLTSVQLEPLKQYVEGVLSAKLDGEIGAN